MDDMHLAKQVEDYIIDTRRDLHRNPEISMGENRTIKVVTDELKKMGIDYEVIPHGGVIGVMKGGRPGKSIILRSDLDAFPMKEANTNLKEEKTVVSEREGVAHLCGHDGAESV